MKILSIAHDIIHNDIKLLKYYRKIITVNINRRGLIINTQHRNNTYGDKILMNIIHDIWNNIPIDIREINEKHVFINKIEDYFNSKI